MRNLSTVFLMLLFLVSIANVASGEDSDFSANVTVTDGLGNSIQLTFGTDPGASDTYNGGLDQYAPPAAPTGAFNANFVSSGENLISDYRASTIRLNKWELEYQVAQGSNSIKLEWDIEDLNGEGTFIVLDGADTVDTNMSESGSLELTDVTSGSLTIEHSMYLSIDQSMTSSWNMIGIPLLTDSSPLETFYSDALDGTLFQFDGSYSLTNSIEAGTGYWLRFPEEQELNIKGLEIREFTLELEKGWNLISGLSTDLAVSEIVDEGEILIDGTLYYFEDAYANADIVESGKGYWIQANDAGTVYLKAGETLTKSAPGENKMVSATEEYNQLIVRGNGGVLQRLYFGSKLDDNLSIEQFSLPPLPPSGIFDARIDGNYRLSEKDEISIQLQGIDHNYTVELQLADSQRNLDYQLDLLSKDELVSENTLSEGQNISLVKGVNQVRLSPKEVTSITDRDLQVPTEIKLHQNHPNPFNPTTKIQFDLPQSQAVNLKVYDMMGNLITTLIDGSTISAGSHEVSWDANSVASGMYLYRLDAGSYTQTQKMMLVK